MLSIETTEDWNFTIAVQIGAFNDTYTNAERSAFDTLETFTVWASAAARPWADSVVWMWSWSKDPATDGAIILLRSSDAATLTMSAGATARLGIASGVGITFLGTTPASGTWAPGPVGMLGVVVDLPFLGDTGDAAAVGAVRPGVPGLAGRRPVVSAMANALGNARFVAVMRAASNPRRGWVYQRHTATWVDIAIGAYQRSPLNSLWYSYTIDAAGEVL